MKKIYKAALGVLSFVPTITMTLVFVKFLYIGDFFQNEGGLSDSALIYLRLLFVGLFIAIFLIIFYLVHAVRDKRITKDRKLLLVVLLVFLNCSYLPFYWYFRILKD